MSRPTDVLVAKKVMGWELTANPPFSVDFAGWPPGYSKNSVPHRIHHYTTDPTLDYGVLIHVLESWSECDIKRMKEYLLVPGYSPLGYSPGDYSMAALKIKRMAQRNDRDGT